MRWTARLSAFISLVMLSKGVLAAGGVGGTVHNVTIKETGYILVRVTAPHANPDGCERNDAVAIASDHIAKKEMLSVVLTAFTSGRHSSFWVHGCYAQYGTSFPLAQTVTVSN